MTEAPSKDHGSWGAVLTGHTFDLQDWTDALGSPHEPWVEKWRIADIDRLVLRSTGFDQLADSTEVWETAKLLIVRLNGLFATLMRGQPLTIDGVAERHPDGYVDKHIVIAVGTAYARARAGSISTTLPQQGPTTVQRWFQLADRNELVEDLLIHMSAAPNWYDLYKSYEAIKNLSGGQRLLEKRSWCPPKDILSTFTHTANTYRHSLAHSARSNSPLTPMPIHKASDIVRSMANGILQELEAE
jgi:hypothetical protein